MAPNDPALPGPILWQRLDLPGHDAAVVERMEGGAALRGTAVFLDGAPTALHYLVRCDGRWVTRMARVRGRRGGDRLDLRIERDPSGRWTLDGSACPEVEGCEDIDLNFTPATNLLPLRRLALAAGQAAEVRSAWLEWPTLRLRPLVQRYRRRPALEYDYEADLPDGEPFRAVLRTSPDGWVAEYGGLWRAVRA